MFLASSFRHHGSRLLLVAALIPFATTAAYADAPVLDSILAFIGERDYLLSLELCEPSEGFNCSQDEWGRPARYALRAQALDANGEPFDTGQVIARTSDMPLSLRKGDMPSLNGKIAWDSATSTVWIVPTSDLSGSLHFMLMPAHVERIASTGSLQATIPQLCAGAMSLGTEELAAAEVLPQIQDILVGEHALTIRLASRNPDRSVDGFAELVFDTETGKWTDRSLLPDDASPPAEQPADPPPANPE